MLDVPLEEILPVSPTSTLKLMTSGVLSKAISFLGDKASFFGCPDCCSPGPLKKNGSLLVIPLEGGDVIVEFDEAVDSCINVVSSLFFDQMSIRILIIKTYRTF